MAKKSWDDHKDPYPIWGTCLGFELLALLVQNMPMEAMEAISR